MQKTVQPCADLNKHKQKTASLSEILKSAGRRFFLWALRNADMSIKPHYEVLNRAWFAHLLQGRYTPYRVVRTAVNVLLLFSMFGTMVSAVILSREVFAFLPISGGIALGRITHIVCVFWIYVLMALHLGLHWNMILGMMRKRFGPVPLFFTEYIGIMGLFVFLAHYGGKGLQRMSGRRKEQKERA